LSWAISLRAKVAHLPCTVKCIVVNESGQQQGHYPEHELAVLDHRGTSAAAALAGCGHPQARLLAPFAEQGRPNRGGVASACTQRRQPYAGWSGAGSRHIDLDQLRRPFRAMGARKECVTVPDGISHGAAFSTAHRAIEPSPNLASLNANTISGSKDNKAWSFPRYCKFDNKCRIRLRRAECLSFARTTCQGACAE
jgi:hypothetical protein